MAPRRRASLLEFSRWLRDPEERARRILDVAESNGMSEGLPALTTATRHRLRDFLAGGTSLDQAPSE